MMISILVFSMLHSDAPFYLKFLSRIILIPLIAGVSYEIIRFAAKRQENLLFRWITTPGLYLQKITTRPPSQDQLEVAIRALQEVLKMEQTRPISEKSSFEVVL